MRFELNEIKEIRKKFGLTQSELAKKADVSQSLIAKVESGRLEPTYSKAMKIFDTLKLLTHEKEAIASEIMEKKIISVGPNEEIKKAINIMKKYEISQMPVIEDDRLVGMISETILLESILNEKKASNVREIMKDPPPIVAMNTSISVISDILRFFPIIVVNDRGKLVGVITKSDLIRKAYK